MKEDEKRDFCVLLYHPVENTLKTEKGNRHVFKTREDFLNYISEDFGGQVLKKILERLDKKLLRLYQMSM